MSKNPEIKIKAFASAAALRAWLAKNGAQSPGLWLRIFKKDSGKKTVTYAQAVDELLCFGWIDGQKALGDEYSYLQKITPRKRRSAWSKRNTEHATRLIRTKRMLAAGLREVTAAKADGRWANAYDSPSTATIPDEFLKALKKSPKAKAFFATLNKTNLYAIAFRLQTAKKPETRERRIVDIIARLERGEALNVMRW